MPTLQRAHWKAGLVANPPCRSPCSSSICATGWRSWSGSKQQESAVLIQSLAEQNAQVVRAVEVLRQRQQRLMVAAGILAVACTGLLVWVLRQ